MASDPFPEFCFYIVLSENNNFEFRALCKMSTTPNLEVEREIEKPAFLVLGMVARREKQNGAKLRAIIFLLPHLRAVPYEYFPPKHCP